MELVINRSKWLRGEGTQDSYLIRSSDQKMCCLGFYGRACGLKDEDITDIEAPDGTSKKRGEVDLKSKWVNVAAWLYQEHKVPYLSGACGSLMEINDAEFIRAETREERIKTLFAANGVTVTFVDE